MLLKKNAFFSLALASLFTLPGVAQIDYNLKDFQTPDIHYRSLDLSSYFGGGSNVTDQSSAINGTGSVNLDFYGYTNTDKYVGNQKWRLVGSGNLSSNENTPENGDESDNKSNHFGFGLFGQSENRWYLNERDAGFLGVHGVLDIDEYNSTSESIGIVDYNNENITGRFKGQLYAAYGLGRIEPVTYARLAYDTYNWLGKKKRLISEPSNEDVDQLGEVMTEVANTRFFDSRFKRIFQLEQIDSALRSSGNISEADMVYFAQVADIWGYANNFSRGSGSIWEFGAAGDFWYEHYSSFQTSNDSVTRDEDYVRDNNIAVYGYVRYLNQKPLNVKWQRDYEVSLYAGSGRHFVDIYDEVTNLSSQFRSTLKAGYQLGFYPNTRTSLQLGVSGYAVYGDNFDHSDEGMGYAADLRGGLYYWISPRFRFSFFASIIYTDNWVEGSFVPNLSENWTFVKNGLNSGDSFATNFRASLSYALF
ncbi:hypothetical protein [Owenweeksia hongkongensis]|uniref:hypothetical protein n=1 Tax=Owenweeksia hongkongensis TaxID=253245 RepID=UPI003A93E27D